MGHLLSGREGKRGEEKGRKWIEAQKLLEFLLNFCVGERRFAKSKIKGKCRWGLRKMIIFHARFSFHTECGLEIRKLWLDTFINSAGFFEMLVLSRAPSLHWQHRQSCRAALPGLQERLLAHRLTSTSVVELGLGTPLALVNSCVALVLIVEKIPAGTTYE